MMVELHFSGGAPAVWVNEHRLRALWLAAAVSLAVCAWDWWRPWGGE